MKEDQEHQDPLDLLDLEYVELLSILLCYKLSIAKYTAPVFLVLLNSARCCVLTFVKKDS